MKSLIACGVELRATLRHTRVSAMTQQPSCWVLHYGGGQRFFGADGPKSLLSSVVFLTLGLRLRRQHHVASHSTRPVD